MAFRVKNWAKFQHFNRRRPTWIKLHHDLLEDSDFHDLPVESRALLPMLWLLASEFPEGEVTRSNKDVALRVHWPYLAFLAAAKPLFDAGFIVFDGKSATEFLICDAQVNDSKEEFLISSANARDSLIARSNKDSENQRIRESEEQSLSNGESSIGTLSSNKENQQQSARGLFDDDDASQGDATARAIEFWNDMAGKAGLPKVIRVTGPRRAKVIARLRQVGGIDGWKAVLERVARSDFLCGRLSGREWQCGLDFILSPSKIEKLMEGNYDNKRQNGHQQTRPIGRRQSAIEALEAHRLARQAEDERGRDAEMAEAENHAERGRAGGMDDDY